MILPGSAADKPETKKLDTDYKVNVMIGDEMIGFTIEEALKLSSQLIIGAEVALADKL